ncbi:unnamed protein product [Cyprideis torosa]|uniref:Centromere/kinetochore protein zw10 C-terminal domain-containing protein n=1 Tax=Cyprideis torosa TaxID=163714 RepID=A0A7R8WC24_9CRUS|nr:unnamed protein product [Cyprideis torosa]CAG0886969.1 unnamed protein product [Cyprideis torosa]
MQIPFPYLFTLLNDSVIPDIMTNEEQTAFVEKLVDQLGYGPWDKAALNQMTVRLSNVLESLQDTACHLLLENKETLDLVLKETAQLDLEFRALDKLARQLLTALDSEGFPTIQATSERVEEASIDLEDLSAKIQFGELLLRSEEYLTEGRIAFDEERYDDALSYHSKQKSILDSISDENGSTLPFVSHLLERTEKARAEVCEAMEEKFAQILRVELLFGEEKEEIETQDVGAETLRKWLHFFPRFGGLRVVIYHSVDFIIRWTSKVSYHFVNRKTLKALQGIHSAPAQVIPLRFFPGPTFQQLIFDPSQISDIAGLFQTLSKTGQLSSLTLKLVDDIRLGIVSRVFNATLSWDISEEENRLVFLFHKDELRLSSPECVMSIVASIANFLGEKMKKQFIDDIPLMESFLVDFGESLVQKFGQEFLDEMVIPNMPQELFKDDFNRFQELLSQIQKFDTDLKQKGFVSSEFSLFKNFLTSAGAQCEAVLATRILGKARKLITGKLDVTQVHPGLAQAPGASDDKSNPLLIQLGSELLELDPENDILPWSPFLFPKCTVSSSVVELVELLERTMQLCATAYVEGDGSGDQQQLLSRRDLALSLYLAVRRSFQLYLSLADREHGSHCDEIPYLAAIFYNNSWLLSHVCQTLGPRANSWVLTESTDTEWCQSYASNF